MAFHFVQSRVALVTGAGALDGIGYAIARQLAEAGLRVHITGHGNRVFDRAAELCAEGYAVSASTCDLTASADVNALVKQVGAVDILVNNAGMGSQKNPAVQKPFAELEEEEWDFGIAVSLKTAFLATRAFLPGMLERRHGRIVNIASVTGPLVSNIGESAYSAAKAGMVGLTHALALEVGRDGVTANSVAPGWVDTGASTDEERAAARATPLGRAAAPREIAAAALFLASDDASYINGATLVVDGGNILQERKA